MTVSRDSTAPDPRIAALREAARRQYEERPGAPLPPDSPVRRLLFSDTAERKPAA